jgi:putative membrane-bound dehydrogenase-like protein
MQVRLAKPRKPTHLLAGNHQNRMSTDEPLPFAARRVRASYFAQLLFCMAASGAGFIPTPLFAQGFPPPEALKRMTAPPGFDVKLVAREPEIRQPVAIYFDERGRIWVNQYLQYPTPAGLKAVEVDQYLRTKYDQVPAPPPRGPRGADKITICEDTDGDGQADKFTDFITGLNLSTGLAIGYGGVFVMQSPYLLFYPDRNQDDIPDGDPEVLLTGFGMEDAHALPNSLQWGPDGWLYGAQGSTVTAHVRGLEFQQGIWRYHPITHEFELFAEGGGNTWGVDFDEHGNLIAGTNFGDDIALHQVQGAYYVKNFGKHGELHNPYAFGYFDHIPYRGFRGGHVTCGGIVYHGGSFPASFDGTYIAANLLANTVYWHVLERDGSSFKGHFGGVLLDAHDTWFRPVDCAIGPDGALYVADWYDKRATHLDTIDSWDRSNGRIYKIEAAGTKPVAPFNLAKMSSHELVGLLSNRNEWFAREARRILAERRDTAVIPDLRRMVFANHGHLALEAFWALYVSGGFNDTLAAETLAHPNEDVRSWTVRLLGDSKHVSPAIEPRLVELARTDPSPAVRNQLACTAKRLPGKDALPIISELWQRDEDVADPQIPLLTWWALESKALSDREAVVGLFETSSRWQRPIVQKFMLERVARRYATEGNNAGFSTCAKLLAMAPGAAETELLVRGMTEALVGRRLEEVPPPLEAWFAKTWQAGPPSQTLVRFGLRLGDPHALGAAISLVENPQTPEADRVSLVDILGQTGKPEAAPVLLRLLAGSLTSPEPRTGPGSRQTLTPPLSHRTGEGALIERKGMRGPVQESRESTKLRTATLIALQRFADPQIARTILEIYPKLNRELQARACNALVSRPAWATELVKTIDDGGINANDITFDQLRQMTLHHDAALDALIGKRWGKVQPSSDEHKASFINELKLLLHPSGAAGRTLKADAAEGRNVFQKTCGVCHTLFGEGNNIGPNLTGADRKTLDFLLINIVNPSAYIRPEYVSYEVVTKDDQVLTGLLADQTPAAITLLDRNNQRHVLPRDQVKELNQSSVSLMPEGLLEPLKPQEILDLFAYLQSDEPAAAHANGQ